MINCCLSCSHLCFQVPKHYLELLSMLPGYRSNYSNLQYTDDYSSPKLLHALMIEHDPYTPDSMDSPSPSAFLTSMEPDTQDYEQKNNHSKKKSSNGKTFKMAVSPTLLKTKLEFIRNEQKAQQKQNSKNVIKSRFNSWPKTYQYKHHCKMKKYRSNSDISWQTLTWRADEKSEPCRISSFKKQSLSHIIIPKIAIINASNFQSNESSVHLQEERLYNFIRNKSISKDATSNEGSSLELDDDNGKAYSQNQNNRVGNMLDVEDNFSHIESLIVSSNETSSTYPLDLNDFGSIIDKNNRFEIDDLEKISGIISNIPTIISSSEQNLTLNKDKSNSVHIQESYNENQMKNKSKTKKITQERFINVQKCKKCCCVVS
ncbi:hypothetical protein KQX54_012726 [Cotesia glomerata]|uniref:Uncharacterized protein n=1 Tax=Cotesia glomerata TaxID=32391 RepID=A0AAV7IL37_COTGL|nr:hypothetical protein KQX54_012726 [Cotesia glomerata]